MVNVEKYSVEDAPFPRFALNTLTAVALQSLKLLVTSQVTVTSLLCCLRFDLCAAEPCPVRAAQSLALCPHSMGCQIRHIIELVNIFCCCQRSDVTCYISEHNLCIYIDVSDFLYGNISYAGRIDC